LRDDGLASEAAAAAADAAAWPFAHPAPSAELPGAKRARARLAVRPLRRLLGAALRAAALPAVPGPLLSPRACPPPPFSTAAARQAVRQQSQQHTAATALQQPQRAAVAQQAQAAVAAASARELALELAALALEPVDPAVANALANALELAAAASQVSSVRVKSHRAKSRRGACLDCVRLEYLFGA
jgi:hypothetical protein